MKMQKNMHRMKSIELKGIILERERKRVKWNINEEKISSHEKRMKTSSEKIQNILNEDLSNENLLQQRRNLVEWKKNMKKQKISSTRLWLILCFDLFKNHKLRIGTSEIGSKLV